MFRLLLISLVLIACSTHAADELDALKQAAEQGHAKAQFILGMAFEKGQGVPRDGAQAVYRYRQAAGQGFTVAQYNLGAMHAAGQGVPRDDDQVVYWWSQAAERGHVWVQFNLGVMYAQGQGVPQDEVQAYVWLNAAAAQGNQQAMEFREALAPEMTPAAISEAQELSDTYRKAYSPVRGMQ